MKTFKLGKNGRTVRRDTVKKLISAGAKVVINYCYTDDYVWDASVNFKEGCILSTSEALKDISFGRAYCWFDKEGSIIVSFGYTSWTVKYNTNEFKFV